MHFTSSPEPDGRLPFDIWQFLSSFRVFDKLSNRALRVITNVGKCQGNVKDSDEKETRGLCEHISDSEDWVQAFWFFKESMLQQSYKENSKKKSIKLEDVCSKGLDRPYTSVAVWQIPTSTDGIHW